MAPPDRSLNPTGNGANAAREDPFDLSRFVEAQSKSYPLALAELREGKKQTHWIWYVLPQLRGLVQVPGRPTTESVHGRRPKPTWTMRFWGHDCGNAWRR